MNIDEFFNRQYDEDSYNCAHFVCEVWAKLTGESITDAMRGFLQPAQARQAAFSLRRYFDKLDRPESPCIALMQRPRAAPHVGIYLRGRILHITELGVEFLPADVASRGFVTIKYYHAKNNRTCA